MAVGAPAATAASPAPTPTTIPAPQVPPTALLAAPKGTVPTYGSPGGSVTGSVGTWYGYALVLPVIAQAGGFYQVRLPQRPNGATAWVAAGDVTTSTTPYHITVSLSAEHLTLYKSGQPVINVPVGIGVPATPTPAGNFFVAVHELQPERGYGPVVLDLSAHSETIRSWQGAGDAIIAIHGPIDSYADSRIGTTGARLSNGCIRMHVADLAKLDVIGPGTPVDITA